MNVVLKAEQGSTVNVNDIHDVGTGYVGTPAPSAAAQPGREQQERMHGVIQSLINDGLFREKQDFEALRRIIVERGLGGLGYEDFARYLCREFDIPEHLRPSGNNLKRVVFGQGTFPGWKTPGLDDLRHARFLNIASLFLRGMGLEP